MPGTVRRNPAELPRPGRGSRARHLRPLRGLRSRYFLMRTLTITTTRISSGSHAWIAPMPASFGTPARPIPDRRFRFQGVRFPPQVSRGSGRPSSRILTRQPGKRPPGSSAPAGPVKKAISDLTPTQRAELEALAALHDAERRIERDPAAGLPAPRPLSAGCPAGTERSYGSRRDSQSPPPPRMMATTAGMMNHVNARSHVMGCSGAPARRPCRRARQPRPAG